MIVTPDKALRRSVKRLTTATGASAQFVDTEQEINPVKTIDLAIFDARTRDPSQELANRLFPHTRILYILDERNLAQRIHLFGNPLATSLLCHGDQFDDDEFISSATKALRGDVFGLQKYFPWGVTTFTMLIKNYDEKLKAIEIMMSYAKTAGVRGPVRDRIQLVADELLMNALYHAPVDVNGNELYSGQSPKELAQLGNVNPIEVQYGCSGRYFGVSVRDGFGSLTKEKSLTYLMRATNLESQIETKEGGAGLGLISVLKSVSKLVFNLDPGYSTEVIGLFDMQVQPGGRSGARSLHIFTAAPSTVSADPDPVSPGSPEPPAPNPKNTQGMWTLIAVLCAAVAALGTAFVIKKQKNAATQGGQTLQIIAEPAGSTITVNGKSIDSGSTFSIAPPSDDSSKSSDGSLIIEVSKSGFEDWTRTLSTSSLKTPATIYVDLHPE